MEGIVIVGKLDKYLENAENSIMSVDDAPDRVPASVYNMLLQDAHIEEFGDRGLPKIMWEHLIEGGEQDGQVVFEFSAIVPDPEKMQDAKGKRGQTFALQRGKAALTKMCEFARVPFPDDLRDLEGTVLAIKNAAPRYRTKIAYRGTSTFPQIDHLDGLESNGTAARKPAPKAEPEPKADALAADDMQKGDKVTYPGEDGKSTLSGAIMGFEGSSVVIEPDDEPGAEDVIPRADVTLVEDDTLDQAYELAQQLGAEVKDDMALEDVVTAINAIGPYKPDGLNDDEKALCEEIGVKIAKPKPARRVPKAKPKTAKKRRRS